MSFMRTKSMRLCLISHLLFQLIFPLRSDGDHIESANRSDYVLARNLILVNQKESVQNC
jgi:hypothetical protein